MVKRETIVGVVVLACAVAATAWFWRGKSRSSSEAAATTNANNSVSSPSSGGDARAAELKHAAGQEPQPNAVTAGEGLPDSFVARQQSLRNRTANGGATSNAATKGTEAALLNEANSNAGMTDASAAQPSRGVPPDPFASSESEAADAWTAAPRDGVQGAGSLSESAGAVFSSVSNASHPLANDPQGSAKYSPETSADSPAQQSTETSSPPSALRPETTDVNSVATSSAAPMQRKPQSRVVFSLHDDEEPENWGGNRRKGSDVAAGSTLTRERRTIQNISGQLNRPMQTYLVNPRDTLFSIAERMLGNGERWTELHELNRDLLGDNPHYLEPGQELVVPDEGTDAR